MPLRRGVLEGAGAPGAGKNARYDKGGTRELFMGVYSVGQAVMSAADPTKVLHRAGEPLLVPDQPFETEGQVSPPPAPPKPGPPPQAACRRSPRDPSDWGKRVGSTKGVGIAPYSSMECRAGEIHGGTHCGRSQSPW